MSLVRAWLAAIGVYLAGELMLGIVVFTARPPLTGDPEVALLWGALPALIIYAAMSGTAAALHRGAGPRHWAAVLSVPVAALAASTALSVALGGAGDIAGLVANTVASAAGTIAGWQATDRLRARRPGEPNPYGT